MDNSYRDTIRSIPITDYAERLGMHIRSVASGRYVSLKEHDSVRIDLQKNCFWRNSTNASGSIIDFALEFQNESGCYSAKEAMDSIAEMYGIERSKMRDSSREYAPPKPFKTYEAEKPMEKKLMLPSPKVVDGKPTSKRAWHYLVDERKIDKGVVNFFRHRGMLYQDEHNNCVFKTNDFACLRSTGGKKFAIDVSGCNYDEGFFFRGKNESNKLYVCEGVIDIMSVMSLRAMQKQMYTDSMYLALSGVGKTDCIYNHLNNEPTVNTVYLCFDNDEAGRKAHAEVKQKLAEDYPNIKVVDCFAPRGKDWNEYLVLTTSSREEKQMSAEEWDKAIEDRKKSNPIANKGEDNSRINANKDDKER